MKFETSKLRKGVIKSRYKRFMADITLFPTDELITAHVANTGSMKTCWEPGWDCTMTYTDDPKRKLKYSLQSLYNGNSWIGVNTALTNKLAFEALENGVIQEITEYDYIKPEFTVGDSRIDFYLEKNKKKIFVEVKNVTLKDGHLATFPDSQSTRGQKHLMELTELTKKGHDCYMLYIIQREDITAFSPAYLQDPVYSDLMILAMEAGVHILPYICQLSPEEIKVSHRIPLELE